MAWLNEKELLSNWTEWASTNGLSEEEKAEYQRLKWIENLAKTIWKEVPEDVKRNLKKYENKLLSNWAEWVAAGWEWMTQVDNDKRKDVIYLI